MKVKYAKTYAERMELIREVHQNMRGKPKKRKVSAGHDPDLYYTDASKYAENYYGESYRQTVRYDNEWD